MATTLNSWLRVASILSAFAGCSAATTQPPGVPPTPSSVTQKQPGGDAQDPHYAALSRQLQQPWSYRLDRDQQLKVPLADAQHWKRVRFWVLDHFTGFRYGEDFHGISVVFVQDVAEGGDDGATSCLRQIEKWAQPQIRSFDVKMGPLSATEARWRNHRIPVRMADAFVDFGFGRTEFSTAWASYPAYPGACMVFAIAVPWRDHAELARQVRDRWILEAVPRLTPLTATRPHRK